jgi:hypothetical protein
MKLRLRKSNLSPITLAALERKGRRDVMAEIAKAPRLSDGRLKTESAFEIRFLNSFTTRSVTIAEAEAWLRWKNEKDKMMLVWVAIVGAVAAVVGVATIL